MGLVFVFLEADWRHFESLPSLQKIPKRCINEVGFVAFTPSKTNTAELLTPVQPHKRSL